MPAKGFRLEVDAREIARLYVEERLTLEAVAARCGCGASTVRRRLGEMAISRRSRGPGVARRPGNMRCIQWSADLAYVVGLIATDGNLSPNGRGLTIVSKDMDLLQTSAAVST